MKAISKDNREKIVKYIINIITVALMVYCIKALTDYDNMIYQTWKNQTIAKAVCAFIIIIFLMRKLKAVNWQSLVCTLIFIPIWIERMTFWKESPDILIILRYQIVAEWLAALIIIDMMLYKGVNDFYTKKNWLFVLYIALTIGMLLRRNGRIDPILLVIPFLLFMLVLTSEEKWEWFLHRMTDSWFFTFLYVAVRSLKEYPYKGGRYYGYFLNIGPFGMFMSCAFIMAFFAMMFSKKKYGRKSFQYCLSVLWIIGSAIFLWMIDTRTLLFGVAFAFISLFFLGRKDIGKKKTLTRLAILLGVVVILIVSFIMMLKCVGGDGLTNSHTAFRKWKNAGLLSPFVGIITRFKLMARDITGDTLGARIASALDLFTSGRISIAKAFVPYFNYEGNGPIGLQVEDYWAYNPHNNYIQVIVEYGYITAVEYFTLFVSSFVIAIKTYIKNRELKNLFPIMWLSMTLGLWLGEASSLMYPATFFSMLIICRFICLRNNSEHKTESSQ